MKGRTFTNDELQAYCKEHIQYELQMLRWTAAILSSWQDEKSNYLETTIHNSLLNSFATHSRNLIDFLYLKNHYHRDKPSDVLVENYVEASFLSKHLPPIDSLLDEAKRKTNKQVAHLTFQRSELKELRKEWAFLEIYRRIMRVFYKISAGFDQQKISQEFHELISQNATVFKKIVVSRIFEKGTAVGVLFKLSLKNRERAIKKILLRPTSSTSGLDSPSL